MASSVTATTHSFAWTPNEQTRMTKLASWSKLSLGSTQLEFPCGDILRQDIKFFMKNTWLLSVFASLACTKQNQTEQASLEIWRRVIYVSLLPFHSCTFRFFEPSSCSTTTTTTKKLQQQQKLLKLSCCKIYASTFISRCCCCCWEQGGNKTPFEPSLVWHARSSWHSRGFFRCFSYLRACSNWQLRQKLATNFLCLEWT